MKTIAEVKKELKALKKEYRGLEVTKISVTVIEEDLDEGYFTNDICLNVWLVDKWGNGEFMDFITGEYDFVSTAEQMAKMQVANLNRAGFKATYGGVENC